MDAFRFDALSRSFSDSRSRRGALAAVFGGALGLHGLAATTAKHKKKHKKKRQSPPSPSSPPGAPPSPPPPPPFAGDLRCQAKRPILVDGVCPPLNTLDDILAVACVTGSPTEVCLCAITVRGTTECVASTGSCTIACDDDHDCPPGHVCLQTPESCCPANPALMRSCAALCP